MVSEEKYRVVFNSREIERRYRRRAKREMTKMFRLNRKKASLLFSFKRITIKKNITFQQTVRLQLAVEQTGGVCEIRPMISKTVALQAPLDQVATPTVPLSNRHKTVSLWYDHVTETFVKAEDPCHPGPRVLQHHRQVADRRLREDRRLAIRMEIGRRGTDDRREENRLWKRSWRK